MSKRMDTVFQEHSMSIFKLSDKEIDDIVRQQYLPRVKQMEFESEERRDEAEEMLEENLFTPDFKKFYQAVLRLCLHMNLNDPPIKIFSLSIEERKQKESHLEKFDLWMFTKNDYYCIDGFPKEGNPCAIVLPPPFRAGYVYQGIKPAVIVFESKDEKIKAHITEKQEQLLEQLKQKRHQSIVEEAINESKKLSA